MTELLEKAYRATTYRVFMPEGVLDLRVDLPNPAFAAWLQSQGVSRWALMTAANPASRPLSGRENAERQARLECILLEKGFEPYAGENISDNSDWPVEETCLVLGISGEDALAIALQFGQSAILRGEADGLPRLVWTEEGDKQGND